MTSFAIVAGVTGAPSGAAVVQKGFHHLISQVDPPGWRYQLGFRPAVNLSYTDNLRASLTASDGHDFADLVAIVERAARQRPHERVRQRGRRDSATISPIRGAPRRARARVRATSASGSTPACESRSSPTTSCSIAAYAKNDSSFSVERIPWVTSYQFGIAIRRHSLTIAFGGTHDGKEYETEEVPNHSYGTITVTVDRGPERALENPRAAPGERPLARLARLQPVRAAPLAERLGERVGRADAWLEREIVVALSAREG